jgi:hypothetical protein
MIAKIQTRIISEQDDQQVTLFLRSRTPEGAFELVGKFQETGFFQNERLLNENAMFVFTADGYFSETHQIIEFLKNNKLNLYPSSFICLNAEKFELNNI